MRASHTKSSNLALIMNKQQKKDFTNALKSEHYEAANLIFHAVLNEDNHDTVLDVITSAEHALELMRLDPINTKIILKNTRLRQLIRGKNDDSTTTPIGFYKLSGRKPSFYADIDQETGEVDLFQPEDFLGHGCHAHVRLFSNARGTSIAVKTPIEQTLGTSKESMSGAILDYQNEHKIMQRAYKNSHTCKLFYFTQTNEWGEPEVELRSIMPYIHGETVYRYLQRVQSPHALAQVVLGMTKALIRLHQDNIIHGDIKLDNIMISIHPSLKITFIDFGLSYLLTDETASIFSKEQRVNYLAPERFDYPHEVPPHTNQDVYSFAYSLRHYIIDTHPEGAALEYFYPCLANFATNGQNSIPEHRPSLASLHEALSIDMHDYNNDELKAPTTRPQATEAVHGCGIH
jgi:serine/threonine protein kinase